MRYLLTGIGLASLLAGGFWHVGVMFDVDADKTAFLRWALAASVPLLLAAVAVTLSRDRGQWPLELGGYALKGYDFLTLLIASVLAYVLLVPLFWSLAALYAASWKGPGANEGVIFAGLMGLWMPLWWAPFFGSVLTWHYLRRTFER